MNLRKFLFLVMNCCSLSMLFAQTVSSRLVDLKTNEAIPYATIQYSENGGVITNEEGLFSLRLDAIPKSQDSLYISCMGYEKIAVSINSSLDSIIYVEPKAIVLSEVYLFDKELDVEDIVDSIKRRLPYNYNKAPVKQRLFLRQSSLNDMAKFNIDFKKSSIEELNKSFIDSVVSILPRSAAYYTESLCDFYKQPEEHRLQIERAAELYDKNNEGSMEALSGKLEKIFKDNVKPNSYLKIKSGIFGTKVQMDSVFDSSEEAAEVKEEMENPEKNYFLSNRKNTLHDLISEIFFNDDSKLNFLDKSGRYRFKIKGYTSIDEAGVYVINFEPKRGADFKGTIYVNIDDYAIVRLQYENVKSLKRIRLLGLSYEESLYSGTTIFTKGSNGKYELRFMDKIMGRKMGVRRPLSVIEKNKYVKGRRKQNELALELDITNFNREKYELVVFSSEIISKEEFSGVIENEDVKATYLSEYDPEFWTGFDIMEPNEAIRNFSVFSE